MPNCHERRKAYVNSGNKGTDDRSFGGVQKIQGSGPHMGGPSSAWGSSSFRINHLMELKGHQNEENMAAGGVRLAREEAW